MPKPGTPGTEPQPIARSLSPLPCPPGRRGRSCGERLRSPRGRFPSRWPHLGPACPLSRPAATRAVNGKLRRRRRPLRRSAKPRRFRLQASTGNDAPDRPWRRSAAAAAAESQAAEGKLPGLAFSRPVCVLPDTLREGERCRLWLARSLGSPRRNPRARGCARSCLCE